MGAGRSSRGRRDGADPAAAEHPLAVVQHGGLARRDRACRGVEDEFGFPGVGDPGRA